MAHACQARVHRTFASRSARGRKAVLVRAQINPPKSTAAGVPMAVAAALMLSWAPAVCPPELLLLQPARADDTSEELLTPYQRRQRELERRRELLRQAREQAEGRANGEVAAPSTAEVDSAMEAANAERRATASQLATELKSSAAAAYESSTAASRFRGFGGFNAAPSPPPPPPVEESAPAPPPSASLFRQPEAPKPAPIAAEAKPPVKKEEPKKPAQPQAPQPAGKQKRRGPLPLFLAELLVLGGFVGVGLGVTKYSDQTTKVLALAGAKGKELYAAAEEAFAKAQQQQAK